MLEAHNLEVFYGVVKALGNVSLRVPLGKITCTIVSNGAGKSTLLKAISGLVNVSAGSILWKGEEIHNKDPVDIVKKGIVMVLEGRGILAQHTVYENLELGAYTRRDKSIKIDIEKVFESFPILCRRRRQLSGTLSGGEQQMLAIGRALMAKPELLMMDEPTLGLAPLLVQEIFLIINDIVQNGTTVLLVEQNVNKALRNSEYTYVLETGQIIAEGKSAELLNDVRIKKAYLGVNA